MASNKARAARTPTQALVILWQDDFFKSPKKKLAIEAELAKRGNHFGSPELGMALMRAKHLTRRGKTGHYEYIQKYPHDVEDAPKPTARKKK